MCSYGSKTRKPAYFLHFHTRPDGRWSNIPHHFLNYSLNLSQHHHQHPRLLQQRLYNNISIAMTSPSLTTSSTSGHSSISHNSTIITNASTVASFSFVYLLLFKPSSWIVLNGSLDRCHRDQTVSLVHQSSRTSDISAELLTQVTIERQNSKTWFVCLFVYLVLSYAG